MIDKWEETRLAVLERDNHTCQICHKKFRVLDNHHIIPLSKGGSHSMDNLVAICRKCHARQNKDLSKLKATMLEKNLGITRMRSIYKSMREYSRTITIPKKIGDVMKLKKGETESMI